MALPISYKYVYDSSGRIVEVVLPVREFKELHRRAGLKLGARSTVTYDIPEELSAAEMTRVAEQGGALDWLKDEPDLYSDEDGEPV
jgi:hypothetical protein